ncbi:MAG: saccharopine dehydrogenase NADP-binding domain-containing protein [Segetibacter sp.]|nr:saccharopine dehydrogenase NADP-binding domain-containing protein [Segetibacter sp.]
MKHILLFGAGKSAAVLIGYLKDLATANAYQVTVADGNLETVQSKVGEHAFVKARQANVENEIERQSLIKPADVVISLLPPSLHYLVALDCLQFGKHLLTASYVDEKIKALQNEIAAKQLLFLCEMGLDPGIDHMSAMKLIHRIKKMGGAIKSFKSHCGGLVAPESDDNPWHYKISWNPKNIILAGKGGAVYRENGKEKTIQYEELFTAGKMININPEMSLAYYPNRDSLGYIPLYGLHEADTFIRTTLRHPDFCFGWKNIVDLKLTNETYKYDTNRMTLAEFFMTHLEKNNFTEWLNQTLTTRLSFAKELMNNLVQLIEAEGEISAEGESPGGTIMLVDEKGDLNTLDTDDIKGKAAETLAIKMHEATLTLKQLFFLGMDSDELINRGNCTAAEILQFILEKKFALQPTDKDMVVMVHEIEYVMNKDLHKIKSNLIVKGEDSMHTAMAKTVGLPLGIAAKLILEGKLTETGLHIPVIASIYTPVLNELKEHGIRFEETEEK